MNFYTEYKDDIIAFFKAFIDLIKAIFGIKEEEEKEEAETK